MNPTELINPQKRLERHQSSKQQNLFKLKRFMRCMADLTYLSVKGPSFSIIIIINPVSR